MWFAATDGEAYLFDPSGMIEFIAARLGVTRDAVRPDRLSELGLNSLDMMELVMEWEEQAP